MATNYPGSLDTGTEQPSPLSTTEMDDAGFEHDVVHTNHSEAIIALETKVGTGSSTAVADSVLAGTGSGTSGWTTTPTVVDLTATGNVDITGTLAVDGIVTLGDEIKGGSGSAADPVFTFASDGDTGMYSAGTDALGFTTGGTSRLVIESDGNVGIGTTSPSRTLDVRGIARVGDDTNRTPDASGVGHLMIDGLGYGGFVSLDGTAMWVGHNAGSRKLYLATDETARLTVDGTGNVGIGTTTPSHPLHVTGSDNRPIRAESSVSGSYIDIQDSATSGEGYVAVGAVGDEARFIAGGSTRMTIDSSGKVGIGTTSPVDMFDVGNASNNGSFRVHASGGSESFRVASNIVRSYNIKNITTGLAANVYISTSNATMYRSTSSIKYKTDVETMEDSYADAILGLRPVWYRSLGQDDPDSWGYWGFIAEEVAEVDPRLVSFGVPTDYERQYDEDGEPVDPAVADLTEPEGVQYDRMVPHLVNLLKRHEARIAALEAA